MSLQAGRCPGLLSGQRASSRRRPAPDSAVRHVRSRVSTHQMALRVAVYALDAAQPFDFEARARQKLQRDQQLTIGIVGFGTFGQFLAARMAKAGHRILAHSRSPYHEAAKAVGAEFLDDIDDFCEEHPDVVILATSILSTEKVLTALPVQRLKRSTLIVDVLSVKVFPKQLMLRQLPSELDVLCTHPMFGPDSGRGSWQGLNFMYDKVRIGDDPKRQARAENFLRFFANEGCRMVEMSCEEHDRQAASTQFITHTVGRILGAMELQTTEINTRGFEALLNLVNNTANDSFELYYGLFLYNQNATEELERLEQAFDSVKKQLFGRLHDIAREQIFPGSTGASSSGGGGSAAAAGGHAPAQQQAHEPATHVAAELMPPRSGNGSQGRALPEHTGTVTDASAVGSGSNN